MSSKWFKIPFQNKSQSKRQLRSENDRNEGDREQDEQGGTAEIASGAGGEASQGANLGLAETINAQTGAGDEDVLTSAQKNQDSTPPLAHFPRRSVLTKTDKKRLSSSSVIIAEILKEHPNFSVFRKRHSSDVSLGTEDSPSIRSSSASSHHKHEDDNSPLRGTMERSQSSALRSSLLDGEVQAFATPGPPASSDLALRRSNSTPGTRKVSRLRLVNPAPPSDNSFDETPKFSPSSQVGAPSNPSSDTRSSKKASGTPPSVTPNAATFDENLPPLGLNATPRVVSGSNSIKSILKKRSNYSLDEVEYLNATPTATDRPSQVLKTPGTRNVKFTDSTYGGPGPAGRPEEPAEADDNLSKSESPPTSEEHKPFLDTASAEVGETGTRSTAPSESPTSTPPDGALSSPSEFSFGLSTNDSASGLNFSPIGSAASMSLLEVGLDGQSKIERATASSKGNSFLARLQAAIPSPENSFEEAKPHSPSPVHFVGEGTTKSRGEDRADPSTSVKRGVSDAFERQLSLSTSVTMGSPASIAGSRSRRSGAHRAGSKRRESGSCDEFGRWSDGPGPLEDSIGSTSLKLKSTPAGANSEGGDQSSPVGTAFADEASSPVVRVDQSLYLTPGGRSFANHSAFSTPALETSFVSALDTLNESGPATGNGTAYFSPSRSPIDSGFGSSPSQFPTSPSPLSLQEELSPSRADPGPSFRTPERIYSQRSPFLSPISEESSRLLAALEESMEASFDGGDSILGIEREETSASVVRGDATSYFSPNFSSDVGKDGEIEGEKSVVESRVGRFLLPPPPVTPSQPPMSTASPFTTLVSNLVETQSHLLSHRAQQKSLLLSFVSNLRAELQARDEFIENLEKEKEMAEQGWTDAIEEVRTWQEKEEADRQQQEETREKWKVEISELASKLQSELDKRKQDERVAGTQSAEVEELKAQLSSAREDARDLQIRLEQARAVQNDWSRNGVEVAGFKDELGSLRKRYDSLVDEKRDLEVKLNGEVERLKVERTRTQADLDAAKDEASATNEQVMQLRSQVEALEAREAAALASTTTASGKEEQVPQLSQELQDERTRCREALRGKTDLERQLLVLKAEVEGQWRNTEVASDTIKSLRTQKKALESEVEAAASKASAEIAKANKERDAAYEKVANQKVNFRNLLEERDRYAERLNNALARAESTTRELEAQRCALEEAQTAAEQDRKSSAKTDEHNARLLQKLQQLEADLAATKAELALANSILVEKDEHISRIAADRRALLSQSGRSCEDCVKLPDELRLQNAEINRLKDLLTGVRKESSDKDVKLIKLTKQREELREDVEGLNIALEAKQQEVGYLKRELRRESIGTGIRESSLAPSAAKSKGRTSSVFLATPSVVKPSYTDAKSTLPGPDRQRPRSRLENRPSSALSDAPSQMADDSRSQSPTVPLGFGSSTRRSACNSIASQTSTRRSSSLTRKTSRTSVAGGSRGPGARAADKENEPPRGSRESRSTMVAA